jgi:hypothetical protein
MSTGEKRDAVSDPSESKVDSAATGLDAAPGAPGAKPPTKVGSAIAVPMRLTLLAYISRHRLQIAITTAVLLIVVPLTTVLQVQAQEASALKEARANFALEVTNIEDDLSQISKTVASGKELLDSTVEADVTDPGSLTRLGSAIEAANTLAFAAPKRAAGTEAINDQVKKVQARGSAIHAGLAKLRKAVEAVNTSKEERIQQIEDEKAAQLLVAISPNHIYELALTDVEGNRQQVTIRISDWVKGSDSESTSRAWEIAGGEGQMPFADSNKVRAETGAFVFGTVEIENLTPNFSASNFNRGFSWIFLEPEVPVNFGGGPQYLFVGDAYQARTYSSGVTTDEVHGNPLVKANMESNHWGTSTFVIGVDGVFTPNDPNSGEKLKDITFFLSSAASGYGWDAGNTSFTVGHSW